MNEYEIIKHGRTMLQASRPDHPSDCTAAGYAAKTRLLMQRAGPGADIDTLIAHAKQTRSAATWFSRRAALMFCFRLEVEKMLAEQDKIQRAFKAAQVPSDSGQWEGWKKLVGKIGQLVDWHVRLQREPGPPVEQRKPRHSKRKDMRGLPDDWREQVVRRSHKYGQAVLVQAVTGCRPDELVKGVKLSIDGTELVAQIKGSKVTERSGQPWRRMTWNIVGSESWLIDALAQLVMCERLSEVRVDNAKAYSGAVRAAAKREWPQRKATVTPYCFRHAAASDMKASGMDDAAISQALGHCADVARTYYGQWQQGRARGGVAPTTVKAARPVRVRKPTAQASTWRRNGQ